MQRSRIAGTAAALVGLGILTAVTAGRPALALIDDTAKVFKCAAQSACVTAANTGKGNGVAASSTSLNGVQGKTTLTIASGVYGEADAQGGGAGVAGRALGVGTSSQGVLADGGPNGALALEAFAGTASYADMIEAYNSHTGSQLLVFDNAGDLGVTGFIVSGQDCSGCGAHRKVLSYTATVSVPTIEDVGEGQLRGGQALVDIDRSFRSAIDPAAGYLVLLTPEGETRGLYVAERRPGRFVVRENGSGRSSVGFAYRIVAHPYGAHAPRLPMVGHLEDGLRTIAR